MQKETVTPKVKSEESIRWHFFNLYCMALSDADFDSREKEMLYKIGLEYGIDEDTINQIVLTTGINPTLPQSLEDKVHYLYDLTRMAWADGIIEDSERVLLKKYILRFGFMEEHTESILNYLIDNVKEGKTYEQIINEITQ